MRLDEWFQKAEPYFLTIEDVLNLPSNKQIEILLLDRNVMDIAIDPQINPPNKEKKANDFFKNNYYIKFYKLEPDTIRGIWQWKHSNQWQPELDFQREFDVQLKDAKIWTPLKQGKVQMKSNLGKFKGKSWRSLPKKTLVGWRGPMILKSDLNKLPKIYWSEDMF